MGSAVDNMKFNADSSNPIHALGSAYQSFRQRNLEEQQRFANLENETRQLQALTSSGYNTEQANVVSGDAVRKRKNMSTSLGIN